jgi:GTP-binding protein SAR1
MCFNHLCVTLLFTDQDELIIGKIRFKTFDLGGHEIARKLWREYFATGVDGVVFIVDAGDRTRFPEAKRELDALLTSEELANVPFLILGNKIDLGTAASEDELRNQLGLYETYGKEVSASLVAMNIHTYIHTCIQPCLSFFTSQWYSCITNYMQSLACSSQTKSERAPGVRPIELYMCSVVRKMGYGDGEL